MMTPFHSTAIVSVVVVAFIANTNSCSFVAAFGVNHHHHQQRSSVQTLAAAATTNDNANDESSWSVTDDWNRLSRDCSNAETTPDTRQLLNQDVLTLAALKMQNYGMNNDEINELSPEDEWINEQISHILNEEDTDKQEDGFLHTERFLDDMGREIAMLVRCNENPHHMLLSEGRAVAELTERERNDVRQLVELDEDAAAWKPTIFLKEAVWTMFQKHSRPTNEQTNGETTNATEHVLDAAGVASWMQQSLGSNNVPVTIGQHDKRVTQTMAKYTSQFGKAHLVYDDFLNLYLDAIVGDETGNTVLQLEQHRASQIQAVWRDIRNHGIVCPAEFERNMKLAELESKQGINALQDDDAFDNAGNKILDECEILEERLASDDVVSTGTTTDRRLGKSSHERVELVPGTATVPLWVQDGDFVFIDEQSCIGCMQCTTAAPASFQMLEHNGRARTFFQRKSPDVKAAVNACPVDCMHYVSFDELKELELARDEGFDDHFSDAAPTPLHVSRRDSDANHRSSFYHYLRNKCMKSTQCPQRGCYDCPRFQSAGSNPYFQKRLAKATHVRADFFRKTGAADSYRKTEDL